MSISRCGLAAILGCALVFHLWGIRRGLPYIAGEDATLVVNPAVRIAASGDPNPHRFAHPASTMIYPLAVAYHLWHAAAHGGSWLHVDNELQHAFETAPGGFYIVGRLLAILYALLTLPIVYALGFQVFGTQTALIGTLLLAFYPTDVFNKQVRTESAAMFFTALALYLCLRLLDRPTTRRQFAAGGTIGLAIATKYHLAPLVAVLVAVDAMILWRKPARPGWQEAGPRIAAGLVAVVLGFALSTPYFFLDYATAMQNLRLIGLNSTEVAIHGTHPLGNLFWYLTDALPRSISWPQVFAAGVGTTLVIWQPRPQQLLLLVFVAVFLVPLSLHPWQAERWLIPALPVFALLTAHGLCQSVALMCARVRASPAAVRASTALGTIALIAIPTVALLRMHRRYAQPSTYVLARQWVEEHIPRGSFVAYEWETLPSPLNATNIGMGNWVNHDRDCELIELQMSKLSVRNTLDYYKRNRYEYLVTSSFMYGVYPGDPQHFPSEAAFYRDLLAKGQLLYQVDASPDREGGEIRIYKLP